MAEETALEMRQAGQPARGFKSLHLRESVKFCQPGGLHTFLILPNFSVVNNEKYGIMNNSEREQAKPAHRERRMVYGIHQTKRM